MASASRLPGQPTSMREFAHGTANAVPQAVTHALAAGVVSVLVLAAPAAQAQSAPPQLPAAPASDPPNDKSPGVAFGLSFGVTALSVGSLALLSTGEIDGAFPGIALGTALAGIVVGPSVGHCYVGRCVTTAGIIRLAGAGAVAASTLLWFARCGFAEGDCEDLAYQVGLLGGAGAFVAGTIWDIASAPGAARRRNREHRLLVVPTAVSAGDRTLPGLALLGDF
jgi:hypothetical protein